MASTLPNILDCCDDDCDTCEAVDITGPSSQTVIDNLSVYTIADLRAVATRFSLQFVVVWGDLSAYDGGGGVYTWNPSSTALDDGVTVIRPSDVLAGSPGRFIKLL